MWIRCTNPATEGLRLPDLDEPLEFSSNGTAQVPVDVGERLIEQYEAIEATDNDD